MNYVQKVAVPLSILLLAWPTFSSLFAGRHSEDHAAPTGLSADEITKPLEATRAEQTYLQQLLQVAARPYDHGPLPEASADALKALSPPWKAFDTARTWVTDFLQAKKEIGAINKDRAKRDGCKAKLNELLARTDAKPLKELAEAELAQLKTDQDRDDDEQLNEKVVAEAQKEFDGGNYKKCLDVLRRWKGGTAGTLGTVARLLHDRAMFRIDFEQLKRELDDVLRQDATVEIDQAALDRLIANINNLLAKAPPSGEDDRATRLKSDILPELQMRLEFAKIGYPPPLEAWAETAQTLVNKYPNKGAKKLVQRILKNYLAKGLGTKQTNDNSDEAETLDGQLLQGTFVVQGAGDWYLWTRPGTRTSTAVLRSNLARAPGPPQTVVCVQEYTRRRTDLLGRLHERAAWDGFRTSCQEIQTKLQDYQQKRGRQTLDVSVDDVVRLGDEVLRCWERVQAILQP